MKNNHEKCFDIRVYYEDTDHGGVVYYANYLKFMERGRTEFLRTLGINLDQVQKEFGVMFAVTHADIHYLTSAHFNDALQVSSRLTTARGARLSFEQHINRPQQSKTSTPISNAIIKLACVDANGKACRIPQAILNILSPFLSSEAQS